MEKEKLKLQKEEMALHVEESLAERAQSRELMQLLKTAIDNKLNLSCLRMKN